MSRSRILDGKKQQRSRAKLRKKLDRRRAEKDSNNSETSLLGDFLEKEFSTTFSVAQLETIDLKKYLGDTADCQIASTERLRQLAIQLEDSAYDPQPRAWLALRRIYRFAEGLVENDEDHWELLRSMAISARNLGAATNNESSECKSARRRLFNDAYRAARELKEIRPNLADSYGLLAGILYGDLDGDLEEGLAMAEQALAIEPESPWPLYHRANLLRELKRWPAAAAAYNALDPAFFVGHRAWHFELALENRAYCLLRAGDKDRALEEFQKLIERYEKNPQLAINAYGHYLAEAASGQLRKEIGKRAKALIKNEMEWAIGGFEKEGRDNLE